MNIYQVMNDCLYLDYSVWEVTDYFPNAIFKYKNITFDIDFFNPHKFSIAEINNIHAPLPSGFSGRRIRKYFNKVIKYHRAVERLKEVTK